MLASVIFDYVRQQYDRPPLTDDKLLGSEQKRDDKSLTIDDQSGHDSKESVIFKVPQALRDFLNKFHQIAPSITKAAERDFCPARKEWCRDIKKLIEMFDIIDLSEVGNYLPLRSCLAFLSIRKHLLEANESWFRSQFQSKIMKAD